VILMSILINKLLTWILNCVYIPLTDVVVSLAAGTACRHTETKGGDHQCKEVDEDKRFEEENKVEQQNGYRFVRCAVAVMTLFNAFNTQASWVHGPAASAGLWLE